MKFVHLTVWVFSALLLGSASVSAQEAAKPNAVMMTPAVRDKTLQDAQDLVKNRQAAQAYRLLEPMEFEGSGEVRFDYLLGIAALDSGKPDKATLAFERVLAVDPNFAGARLDMARAYYQLGDLVRAKTEFEVVLKQNPPQAARTTIEQYLGSIAAFEQARRTQVTGYAEGVLGHDSNIANSATEPFTFAPNSPWSGLFPGNQLPSGNKLSGRYEGLNAGIEINHMLSDKWRLITAADLRQHVNQNQPDYNSVSLDGRLGITRADAQDSHKLTLTRGQTSSASTMHRTSTGLSAEWQHVVSPADQWSAFAQYGQSRASGFAATSPGTDARIEGDTDQSVIGSAWVHVLANGKHALFGSVHAGKENDVAPVISPGLPDGGRTDGKKSFTGLRIGVQAAMGEHIELLASLGWQSANYANVNNLAMTRRSEKMHDLNLGLAWHIDNLWTVKPQIALSKKNSNIALYSFERSDVSLTIRRDFK